MIANEQALVVLCIVLFPLILTISWWLTGYVRNYAIRNAIIDYPNERSSHDQPKPRGGGASIVVLTILSIVILYFSKFLSGVYAIAVIPAGLLIAVTGWLDDKHKIKISLRITVYLVSSSWACYWVMFNGIGIDIISVITYLVCVTGVTWLTNLYNFMDGTDGFAAVEAICVSLLIAILAFINKLYGLALLNIVLSAASAGFLIWNWPPARIFMGDVGSCFLGFIFGITAISSFSLFYFPLSIWLILLAVFICDATCTLLKRILNREQWYRAHQSHSYQRLIQSGLSHRQLLIGLLLINLLLLWPVATFIYFSENRIYDITALLLTMSLLALLWFRIQVHSGNS